MGNNRQVANGKRVSRKENVETRKDGERNGRTKEKNEEEGISSRNIVESGTDGKQRVRKYVTKHMKLYPELYRSDVSIHPSYTDLKNLPYHVVCRRRAQRLEMRVARRAHRDIRNCALMQLRAIDGVLLERAFVLGTAPKDLIVPDFATDKERRRINELLRRF